MDYNRAKEMLEKYYSGNSSLKEEGELKEYFLTTETIPDEFIHAKAIFKHFKLTKELHFPEQEKKRARLRIPRIPAIAASIAVILGISLLVLNHSTETPYRTLSKNTVIVYNDDDAIKKIVLPDNNVVWLNRNSGIIYPRKLTKATSPVSIFGEAYFEFSPDMAVNYHVIAENALVKPESGSSFNIYADPDKESTEISVRDGAITVSEETDRNGLALLVTEGNYCSIHKYQKLIFTAKNKNTNYLSWKTDTLVFDHTHMATVKDVLTKYYDVQIEFEDKALAYCQFSGEFSKKPLIDVLNRIRSELQVDINVKDGFISFSGKGCVQ